MELSDEMKWHLATHHTKGRFTPPTLDDVSLYIQQQGYDIDPEAFIDHYTSNGWFVGKTKMKDWKAAIRNWSRSGKKTKKKKIRIFPIIGKWCGVKGCGNPAVKKVEGSAYDHYKCMGHMPKDFQDKYEV